MTEPQPPHELVATQYDLRIGTSTYAIELEPVGGVQGPRRRSPPLGRLGRHPPRRRQRHHRTMDHRPRTSPYRLPHNVR